MNRVIILVIGHNSSRMLPAIAIFLSLLLVLSGMQIASSYEREVRSKEYTLSDDQGPTMKYYLVKHYLLLYPEPYNLSLVIVVHDPDGVDKVSLTYSFDDEPWQNRTMTGPNGGDEYRCFVSLDTNFSEVNWWSSYGSTYLCDVKYMANDTLGNHAETPVCVYTVRFTMLESDSSVDVYDTPDLWYVVGTTGHTVTWMSTGGNAYYLRQEGYLIEGGSGGMSVTICVDSLGVHNFTFSVDGGMWSDWDTVAVHVVEQLPLGYYPGSVDSFTQMESRLFCFILAAISIMPFGLFLMWQHRSKLRNQVTTSQGEARS